MEFHEKLQELRKQKNLTQEQLAEQLYVSRTAISKWESARGYPSIDSLKEISKFFSISLDDLLSGEEIITIAQEDSRKKLHHLTDFSIISPEYTGLAILLVVHCSVVVWLCCMLPYVNLVINYRCLNTDEDNYEN